jgi:hypothetical protein
MAEQEAGKPHIGQLVQAQSGQRHKIVYAAEGIVELEGQRGRPIRFCDLIPIDENVWIVQHLDSPAKP